MTDFDYSKIPIGYYDSILENGLTRQKGLQSCWHHTKFSTIKNRMGKYENHLDIACGPGTFIGKYLDSRSEGWDISEEQIKFAKNKYYSIEKNFKIRDLREAIKSQQKYDVITLLEFIEHISRSEVQKVVSELYTMLNDGGKIIITTPNYRGLWLFLEKIVSIVGPVDYKNQHINRYTPKRVKKEFDYSLLSVDKYINFGIFFSIFGHQAGLKFNKIISKFFKDFFGYSLIITIHKPIKT